MNSETQYLIIGSTGKTGSRVMAGLQALGLKAKGASRNGEVHFDWDDPTSWSAALNGIDAVYLTYYPDLAIPKAPEDISRFCALAKIKGVKHITLLSGRSEPAAQVCENILMQSGISWTVVRASWFNQNFSEGLFHQFIMDGNIALPVTDITEPFIDIDDIADVAIASLFSKHLNRKVGFESISIAEFQSRLARADVPQDVIETVTYLFSEVLDGRSESTTGGVDRALGRPATSFDQYIVKNIQCFTEAA